MSAGYLQQLFTRNPLVSIAVRALDCQFVVSELNLYQGQVKKPLPFTRQQRRQYWNTVQNVFKPHSINQSIFFQSMSHIDSPIERNRIPFPQLNLADVIKDHLNDLKILFARGYFFTS